MVWDIHGSGSAMLSVILWSCGINFIGVKVSLGLGKIDSEVEGSAGNGKLGS